MDLIINGRQTETDAPITLIIEGNDIYLTFEDGVLKLRFTQNDSPWLSWDGATLAIDCSNDW